MKKEKIAALALAGAMVLGMTACANGGGSSNNQGSANLQQNQPQQTVSPAETETPDPGATDHSQPTSTPEENITTRTEEQVYGDVIDQYITAVRDGWSADKLIQNNLCVMCSFYSGEDGLRKLGYSITDVDGDGVKELLIGEVGQQELFALYTIQNGDPVQLALGQERSSYYLCMGSNGGSLVANVGATSDTNTQWSYYTLVGGQLQQFQTVVYDEQVNAENPWSVDGTSTDEESAREVINGYENSYIAPQFTAFADRSVG